MVFVPEDVADARDLGPGHVRIPGLVGIRNPSAGFGYDFQTTLDGALERPVGGEFAQADAGQGPGYPRQGGRDIFQADLGVAHRSEDLDGGAFNGRLQARVKATAAHDIDLAMQERAEPVPQRDELHDAEPGRLEIKEQVHIAGRAGFIAGDGAEQE